MHIYIYIYRYKNKKITIQQNYSKDQNQYYNNNNFATRRNIVRSQKKKNYFTNESKRTCTLIPIKMQLSAKIRKCIFFLFFLLSFFPPPPFLSFLFYRFSTRFHEINRYQCTSKLDKTITSDSRLLFVELTQIGCIKQTGIYKCT